jgi:hypothetical protein
LPLRVGPTSRMARSTVQSVSALGSGGVCHHPLRRPKLLRIRNTHITNHKNKGCYTELNTQYWIENEEYELVMSIHTIYT